MRRQETNDVTFACYRFKRTRLVEGSCGSVCFVGKTARELNSWKEIATFLGVNVRTAQKWEQERHLPVHRLPGGRGRVAADIPALEAWKRTPNGEDPPNSICYRWPLDENVVVELRFIGAPPTLTHLELFTQYLNLVKTALKHTTQ